MCLVALLEKHLDHGLYAGERPFLPLELHLDFLGVVYIDLLRYVYHFPLVNLHIEPDLVGFFAVTTFAVLVCLVLLSLLSDLLKIVIVLQILDLVEFDQHFELLLIHLCLHHFCVFSLLAKCFHLLQELLLDVLEFGLPQLKLLLLQAELLFSRPHGSQQPLLLLVVVNWELRITIQLLIDRSHTRSIIRF